MESCAEEGRNARENLSICSGPSPERAVLPDAAAAVMVTHLNETDAEICGDITLSEFVKHFDRVYLSYCPCNAQPAK